MQFNKKTMIVSHCLREHPILKEELKYRKKYLNVMEYFLLKYSKDDYFAKAMLDNYKKCFLGKHLEEYSHKKYEVNTNFKDSEKVIFKGFKLFTYRYVFICDCFILNAFLEKQKGIRILNDLKIILKSKYHKKVDQLFEILYNQGKIVKGLDLAYYQIKCWKANMNFMKSNKLTILTTANMSAGKSTLINSIVGKTVNKTMNGACTAKIHFIYDKAFEDDYTYKMDYKLELDADYLTLMKDNELNKQNEILVSTYFRTLKEKEKSLCIIDTPGINSSLNKEHKDITKQAILKEKYDKLLYVVNAENAGTNDDNKYIKYICENVDKSKVIFVLNKLDKFRNGEDSIAESIQHLKEDLNKIGYENPLICPVSSYAGRLAKKIMFSEELTEDEIDDYEFLKRKFKKDEYKLSKYYDEKVIDNALKKKSIYKEAKSDEMEMLIQSGVLFLEEIVLGEDE